MNKKRARTLRRQRQRKLAGAGLVPVGPAWERVVVPESGRLVAYGARCTWWDTKDNVASMPSGLPCCPWCGSVLFECDAAQWRSDVQAAQDGGRVGYVRFIDWLRGRDCREFTSLVEAESVWAAAVLAEGATT